MSPPLPPTKRHSPSRERFSTGGEAPRAPSELKLLPGWRSARPWAARVEIGDRSRSILLGCLLAMRPAEGSRKRDSYIKIKYSFIAADGARKVNAHFGRSVPVNRQASANRQLQSEEHTSELQSLR